MIFVNFKTFEEGTGENAIKLTKILEEVAQTSGIKIIPVVQIIDASEITSSTKLEVWIQHIDPISYGSHTGWTLPEEAARIGIIGVFLNHSEHKFSDYEALKMAKEKAKLSNLKTLIFAADLDELSKVCELGPTYVAYEPPELIGSTTTSVAKAQPEIIAQAVEIAKKFSEPRVVGAGVHEMADVKKSIELGAVGVAVATDVVKAADPGRELVDLTEGFK